MTLSALEKNGSCTHCLLICRPRVPGATPPHPHGGGLEWSGVMDPSPQSSLHLLVLTAVTTWAKHKLLPSTSLGGSKDFGESCCPSAQLYGRRDLIPETRTGGNVPELLRQVPIHLAHVAGSDHPPANTTHCSVGQQGCGQDWGHRSALAELAFLWGERQKA